MNTKLVFLCKNLHVNFLLNGSYSQKIPEYLVFQILCSDFLTLLLCIWIALYLCCFLFNLLIFPPSAVYFLEIIPKESDIWPQALVFYRYIIATWCRRPSINQTKNWILLDENSQSLKYKWFTPSGCTEYF